MDARHRDVLVAVIREYIDSTEPVGSRNLAQRHFPSLSAATLRNVMADLEEMGYLVQPHTSAGRVPTDKAYRFYVESFPPAPSPKVAMAGDTLPARRSGIDGFMERTSSHLSSATKLTGLPLATEEVRAIGRELNRRYSGRTVQDVIDMETAPADPLDALHTRAPGVIEQIVTKLRGRTLYVSGAINMLDHPEFWNIDTTRELLRTFEQKERLADLMTQLAGDDGLSVTIGEENPVAEMRECTLITSTYTYRDQVIGILGVVGPRRLPYPEVISIVNETARHVTDALSRVRQDLYLPS